MKKCRTFRSTLKNAIGNNPARTSLRGCLIAFLVLGTAACAAPKSIVSGQASVAQSVARPDGGVRLDTDNQRVASLWAAAERARAENRQTVALELLYEAMEVDPQNSLLWSRAAEIKLDTVEPALAENFAARSNSLAGGNRQLLHRNWLIIEHARGMRGDLLGERSANKEVQRYKILGFAAE